MTVHTWIPGTEPELDQLFHKLREDRYRDKSHRLWKNYSKDAFDNVAILSIYFNNNGEPEVCSSATTKSCWPTNAYRIHNRVWKCHNKQTFLRNVSVSMGVVANSQHEWLLQNTNCELIFISRQTTNWEEWMIRHFNKDFGFNFETDKYCYLTCPNESDDSCWQKIIYSGNRELLEIWNRRLFN